MVGNILLIVYSSAFAFSYVCVRLYPTLQTTHGPRAWYQITVAIDKWQRYKSVTKGSCVTFVISRL